MAISTSSPEDNEALRNASYVRLQWISLVGTMHTYILPKARYLDILAADSPTYPLEDLFFIGPLQAKMEYILPLDRPLVLRPDQASLRPVAHTDGRHVAVMCDADPTGPEETLAVWKGCPRQLVRSAVKDVESTLGVDIKVGFEIEWLMIDLKTGGYVPFSPFPNDPIGGFTTLRGLRGKMLDILEKVAETLEASGIAVWRFHSEMNDQLELALAPTTPLQAVDNLYNAREIIRTVFAKEGITVTMLPKPFIEDRTQLSGCHMHFSLNPRSGGDLPKDTRESFLAGMLDQMKAIFVFGMPLPESYARRFHDGAGEWIGWGHENRRLPVREIASNRWELRCLDHTANAYFFLATVLRAGLRGVRSAMPLKHKSLEVWPAPPENKAMRVEAGVTERTPETIGAALEVFDLGVDQAGSFVELREALGEFLIDQYVDIRKRDAAELNKLSFMERRGLYMSRLD